MLTANDFVVDGGRVLGSCIVHELSALAVARDDQTGVWTFRYGFLGQGEELGRTGC
jgi:hypothetical protein